MLAWEVEWAGICESIHQYGRVLLCLEGAGGDMVGLTDETHSVPRLQSTEFSPRLVPLFLRSLHLRHDSLQALPLVTQLFSVFHLRRYQCVSCKLCPAALDGQLYLHTLDLALESAILLRKRLEVISHGLKVCVKSCHRIDG
jgi:hypothetical protein